MGAIYNQLFLMLLLVLTGVLIIKLKIIDENKTLAKIVLDVTFPMLLFTIFYKTDFSGNQIRELYQVLFLSFVSIVFLFAVSYFMSTSLRKWVQSRTIFVMHTMFGNIVFIGFPILNVVFPGGKGIMLGSCFQFVSDIILWTFGILLLKKQKTLKWNDLKHLLNINIIAIFLGIVLSQIHLQIPEVVINFSKEVGHMTLYLSLIYIGTVIGLKNNILLYINSSSLIYTFSKCLLIPFLFLLLIFGVNHFYNLHIISSVITVVYIQISMPAMVTVVLLAEKYNSDVEAATANAFVSTLFCLLSIPLNIYFVNLLFG